MQGHNWGWIEMLFSFGVVLAWAFRELWLLRRDRKLREEKERQERDRVA